MTSSEKNGQDKDIEKELALLKARSELILNSAGEGIFGVDTEGRHKFVNSEAARVLGYDISEMLGQPSHKMWHHTRENGEPYPKEECPIYAAYKDGKVHRGTELFWKKDGSSFWAEYISTPMKEDGKLVGAVVVFTDITERNKNEDEMRRNLKELRKFQELMVGRELKMIELKKEIRELKEKCKLDSE